MALSAAVAGEEGADHSRSCGGGGASAAVGPPQHAAAAAATMPVAMVLTKTEGAGNVLGAATAAMADFVVCAGCRRGRE